MTTESGSQRTSPLAGSRGSAPGLLLEVEGLDVTFITPTRTIHAVRDLSFTLSRERLAIVGESGSGKSMTGRALLGLVPPPGRVSARRLAFKGRDLMTAPAAERRALRGRNIAMVMQDPKFSLNPVMSVGRQITESITTLTRQSARAARDEAIAMLEAVKIRDPSRVYDLYPHEVSGGMGQRVMIAMMLAAKPDVLIADEPTSALDVTVQAEVLAILDELVQSRGMGLIFISHDLQLVSAFSDRVIVMYAGCAVETLAAKDLANARHGYTQGLLGCLPDLDRPRERLLTLVRDPSWSAP